MLGKEKRKQQRETFEAQQITRLEFDKQLAQRETANIELKQDNELLQERVDYLERARTINCDTMVSMRDTINFELSEKAALQEQLRAVSTQFGPYVIGLIKRSQNMPELDCDAETRAFRMAEVWVRKDITLQKIREKRVEIDATMQQRLDEGWREELNEEIGAELEKNGTFATVRQEVEDEIRQAREDALIQDVIEATRSEVNSDAAIAAQRAEIAAGLEDDGTLRSIERKARNERELIITSEVMHDAYKEAAERFAAEKDEIRAMLEAEPYIIAKRDGAIATEVQRLTDLSAESFMAATGEDDPTLRAHIVERARLKQIKKEVLVRQRELNMTWSEQKSIDLALVPEGITVTLEGSVPGDAPKVRLTLERYGDEFLVNKVRAVCPSGKLSDEFYTTEYQKRFVNRMALIGRTLKRRNGEIEWTAGIAHGSLVTVRTDETGKNDMQFKLSGLKLNANDA